LPGINIYNSNRDTKDRLRGWVSEKFWENLKIARTAVDPVQIEAAYESAIDAKAERIKFGIAPDDFVVLCVGQFIDRKGRWIFLDAARQIIGSDKNVSFVWLTPHMPGNEDIQRIAEYGLGDKFSLVLSEEVGADRLDVLRFFRIADVFTLPSYVEGLPGSMLEAMALGVPSISTNVYAIPEALKDNDTGLLIPAGNSDALAEAIMKLRNDDELRTRLARRGREFVLENLDERDTAEIIIREYTEALERGR
jgi:glycosyltransferase involved in cell wall biosynthesis